MLYEVITWAALEAGQVVALFGVGSAGKDSGHIGNPWLLGSEVLNGRGRWLVGSVLPYLRHRITSYNVCYTKLLRAMNRLEDVELQASLGLNEEALTDLLAGEYELV